MALFDIVHLFHKGLDCFVCGVPLDGFASPTCRAANI
jgi:hypothetical protein